MFLVLLETSGNQSFIFATNKLRENLGASELTYRAGTQWILNAVSPHLWNEDRIQFRQNLRNQSAITDPNVSVEVIIATSGKALLLTQEEAIAKQIITCATTQALKEAPGLDLCGAIHEFNWETDNLGEANTAVHKKFTQIHAQKPGVMTRFLQLPVVAECDTSGLPAAKIVTFDGRSAAQSSITIGKQNAARSAKDRMSNLLKGTSFKFAENIDTLEKKFEDFDWLAIVHADGNGLGEIFLKFHSHLEKLKEKENPNQDNRYYIETLRNFSIALDECTEAAFLSAINKTFDVSNDLPIIPLILGGDDLTVLCKGEYALTFTQHFLQAFEAETADKSPLKEIAEIALGYPRLSACAGIAIVKPHFPFSVAYGLAEELIKSAKTVKTKIQNSHAKSIPCSAIDFHILYDTSSISLESIRQKLTVDITSTKLYAKPYIVTNLESLQDSSHNEWIQKRTWQRLKDRVKKLQQKEDGRYCLPNSQMHDLRDGLFAGKAVADARYRLIRDRYKLNDIGFEEDEQSLFWLVD